MKYCCCSAGATAADAQVLKIARQGAAAGCHEALFTLGERPEDRYPAALQWLTERHPEQFRAHSGLAEALAGLHKDKEALAAFQSALAVLQQEKDPSPYSRMLASRTQRRIQVVTELLAKGR